VRYPIQRSAPQSRQRVRFVFRDQDLYGIRHRYLLPASHFSLESFLFYLLCTRKARSPVVRSQDTIHPEMNPTRAIYLLVNGCRLISTSGIHSVEAGFAYDL